MNSSTDQESKNRLRALANSGLLDTLPEPQFDRITRLALIAVGAQVTLLSLVDAERQFFKSACGLPSPWSETRETPLSHSFCQNVVTNDRPFVIDDARVDPVVRDNLAIKDLGVVAYLGVPVHSPDGHTIAALCAICSEPRAWSKEDLRIMLDLAAIVENELLLRAKVSDSDLLLREYHHRVKNALSVASSLVRLSGRESTTVAEVVAATQGRLKALADAHDSLISESDDVDLAQLVSRLLLPYCSPGSVADVDGPVVLVRQGQVTPLCLVFHELATNSAKYGAFSHHGAVVVRWTMSGDMISLVWDEKSELIDLNAMAGFGTRLIDIAVAQLKGTLDRDRTPERLTLTMKFPTGRRAEDG